MGRAKAEQMEREEQIHHTISLCIEVGAIYACEDHDGSYIDSMEYSDPDALTVRILEEIPDALGGFKNRDEMVECVREALAHAGEECGYCAKNRDS